MINPELALYLVITGYGDDPAPVTALLDLPPTEVWVRGDAFSRAFPEARRARSQWMLASGLDHDAPFRDHAVQLLALLEARADALREAAARWPAGIAVGRYYHTGAADFFLDEALIARFAALGLHIAFDQLVPEREDIAPAAAPPEAGGADEEIHELPRGLPRIPD